MPAGLSDDDGELVERGAFRLDPAAAAEKLAEFQLPDAELFLVPWLRAAVASGARRVSAGVEDGALTFQFDGESPDPSVLGNLTSAFLAGDGGPVASNLAYGALALQRLAPDSLHAGVEDGLTVLRARWAKGGPARDALKKLRAAYGMTPAVLTVDGEPVPDPARAAPALKEFGLASARGVIVKSRGVFGGGRLHLYHLGAWVESRPFDHTGEYEAYVTNDRFALALSQNAVVKDRRYEKTVRRLDRLKWRLAQKAAREQRQGWVARLRGWINS